MAEDGCRALAAYQRCGFSAVCITEGHPSFASLDRGVNLSCENSCLASWSSRSQSLNDIEQPVVEYLAGGTGNAVSGYQHSARKRTGGMKPVVPSKPQLSGQPDEVASGSGSPSRRNVLALKDGRNIVPPSVTHVISDPKSRDVDIVSLATSASNGDRRNHDEWSRPYR